MEEENQRKVEAMTEEERETERKEILERFGPNIAEVLRKARAARESAQAESHSIPERPSRLQADAKVLKSAFRLLW
jgi:RNA polymerase II-associated protein 1